jgi:hypothetical protein
VRSESVLYRLPRKLDRLARLFVDIDTASGGASAGAARSMLYCVPQLLQRNTCTGNESLTSRRTTSSLWQYGHRGDGASKSFDISPRAKRFQKGQEANSALRSIVRRDTGEGYEQFLTRLVLRFTPVNDGYSVENAPDESVWFPLSSIASTSHL